MPEHGRSTLSEHGLEVVGIGGEDIEIEGSSWIVNQWYQQVGRSTQALRSE
jgi:hypothetical protein